MSHASPVIAAIVLAGGRSSRFGSDKLAVQIDGRSVLDRAIDALATVATDVIVVGGGATRSEVRTVADPEPFGGPLQALAGALDVTTASVAIVAAGDMPSLVPAVLALQLETLDAASEVDAVVLIDPEDPARRQPVPLAIRVEAARDAASVALDAGDRSLVRLLARMRVGALPLDRWLPLDPDARTLVDIDVPADIRKR